MGKTWSDNVQIDTHDGAYPSMIELPDGRILCVYFDEAAPVSAIQSVVFRATTKALSWPNPLPIDPPGRRRGCTGQLRRSD